MSKAALKEKAVKEKASGQSAKAGALCGRAKVHENNLNEKNALIGSTKIDAYRARAMTAAPQERPEKPPPPPPGKAPPTAREAVPPPPPRWPARPRADGFNFSEVIKVE